jgi:hypothetical protein
MSRGWMVICDWCGKAEKIPPPVMNMGPRRGVPGWLTLGPPIPQDGKDLAPAQDFCKPSCASLRMEADVEIERRMKVVETRVEQVKPPKRPRKPRRG